jgi:glucosyl-dolichyl phosphate glucuronosyltransferase
MRVPDVSVVICAYTEDRWEQIRAAVDSVRRQSLPAVETILVCDYNPALSARARAALPDVTVLDNEQAKGLSGARNTGAGAAKGAIIAFLDDDAVAHEDWLKFLADSYENPAVAGVGGLTLPQWQTARPAWLPEEFYWVVGCNYRGMAPSGAPVRNLIGANMSFRREVFDLVEGGFAVDIGRTSTRPLGCEETEFCIRLGQASPGSLLVMDHRATIWHFVSDSRCTFGYFISRCYAEGISKAQVTANVGSGDGLSAERSYTTRTLPLGVLRGVADLFRGDATGLGRAAAIVTGLGMTTAGYARTKLARAVRKG